VAEVRVLVRNKGMDQSSGKHWSDGGMDVSVVRVTGRVRGQDV